MWSNISFCPTLHFSFPVAASIHVNILSAFLPAWLTDTTDGGIKNPGAGDILYPTINIPGK